jgi:nitric oxide reductase subunit B
MAKQGEKSMHYNRLWVCLAFVMVTSFAILGYYGGEIYRQAPPVPERVVTSEGELIWRGADIKDGQNVWQSIGGQQLGSIWGHGAYVAPDWSADWLHRESLWLLEDWARQHDQMSFKTLDSATQALLMDRLKHEIRPNTYDPASPTASPTISSYPRRKFPAMNFRSHLRSKCKPIHNRACTPWR